MFHIVINGTPFQLGAPLPPTITSLIVQIPPGIAIPSHQSPNIRSWLSSLQSALTCKYVTFNGTLILTSDLRSL